MTNAEKIKSMTDEGLAEVLRDWADCFCIASRDGCTYDENTCRKAWVDWLRQEVSEDA